MTRRAILLALALALSPILQAAVVQDLTGKWDGTFIATVNGQQEDDVVFMTLTQKGAVLTGTVGPSLDRQWAIIGGKVEGTKVTFDTQSDGPFVKFTLTLVDGRLKGDAVAEMDGQK
ncbi:MAG: hypothetical protein IPL75_13445 [Acidobacteria bacterium]|nr:hypothetical protein [Acidobacteriota bacterium]